MYNSNRKQTRPDKSYVIIWNLCIKCMEQNKIARLWQNGERRKMEAILGEILLFYCYACPITKIAEFLILK